jgi:Glycosyl transferase family 2/Dolichyl-phosphate-mannose-protein mannosyltransferase
MTTDQMAPEPGGVTVVLPAYREEANLATTVEDMLEALAAMGEGHYVVIVNDGSDDSTGDVADELAARHPGRVQVVHHEVNKGYGAAVRTGIATALERTDAPRLFLTDSDGQFRATQLPWFVSEALTERADAVIGFRPRRADSTLRKVNAWLWTRACRLLLGVRAKDVDCAYKLVDRRVLNGVELTGDAAMISPELLMNLRARGARILQRPVEHFPRQHGEQTGAKLSVILISLVGLLGLWRQRMRGAWPGRAIRRLAHPRDPVLAALTVVSAVASVVAYLFFAARHVLLAYPDTVSHLLIARRVVGGPTPGVAQLGTVWLPLPHLLALPTVWIDAWYSSGLSGSVISMAAYVLTTRYLYRTGLGLTGTKVAGLIAALVFAANPNVLYLQSTPTTDVLLLACAIAAVYHLMRWCQDGAYQQLAATAAAALLASLTGYEGWALDLAVLLAIAYVAWRREPGMRPRDRIRSAEAHLVFYGSLALSGVAGWIGWNAAISGNPLYFKTGALANPSPLVSGNEADVGHLGASVLTYLRAIADDAGWIALALAAIGLGYYLAKTRLRPETVAPLTLLVFFPFYVYSLYSGQRALQVTQIGAGLYNARFGAAMVLPVAIFAGYLAVAVQRYAGRPNRASRAGTLGRTVGIAALCCAVAASVATVAAGGIDTLKEAQAIGVSASVQADARAGAWLRSHYSGGWVLMESAGNQTATFDSHIPVGQILYEGSPRQWQSALRHPASHGMRWIYMRRTPGYPDDVWRSLHTSPELSRYVLVYAATDQLIYRER